VAEVALVFENAPPPLTLHFTPSSFRSLVTVAVSVTESAPSTVAADAVSFTLTGLELPPQPANPNKAKNDAKTATDANPHRLRSIDPSALQWERPLYRVESRRRSIEISRNVRFSSDFV
jgi:hypothetical protein